MSSMDASVVLLYIALLYSAGEGLREYLFFVINKKGHFPDTESDKKRKTVNAGLFISFAISLGIVASLSWWSLGLYLLVACFFRFTLLDGVLNTLRGLPFFYVGSVADMDVALRFIALKMNVSGRLLAGFIKISGMLFSGFLYFYYFLQQ